MEKVLITGGTGFVGRYVVKTLKSRGYEIHLIVRNLDKGKSLFGDSVSYHILSDLTNRTSLSEIVKSVKPNYVVHLIGIIQEQLSKGVSFEKVHYEYSKSLYEVLRENPPTRIVHMSALGVDERAPSKYHRTKLKAEKVLKETGVPHVIIRPSFILGPEQLLFLKIREVLSKTSLILFPNIMGYYFQPVDVRDVAEAFANGLTYSENHTFELCGNERKTLKDIVKDYVNLLGKNVIFLPLPKPLLELLPVDQIKMMWRDNTCGLSGDAYPSRKILGRDPIPYADSIKFASQSLNL